MCSNRKVAFYGSLLLILLTLGEQVIAAKPKGSQLINLTLKDKVIVTRITYALGEIAHIESKDMSLLQELTKLKIGKAPRVGYRKAITWQAVRSTIEQAYPGLYSRIEFGGAKSVAIETLGISADASVYVNPAREALSVWLDSHYQDYEIKLKGRYKDLQLPRGKMEIQTKLPDLATARASMNVWMNVLIDGNHYQSQTVRFDVKAFAPVLVASQNLKKGNIISKDVLRKDYKNVAKLNGLAVDENQLVLKRLKQSVDEGEVIVHNIIEAIPAVSKGEKVSVTAQARTVSITATAIALDDGNVGDKIKVQKPSTSIVYQVKVTGRKLAKITGE